MIEYKICYIKIRYFLIYWNISIFKFSIRIIERIFSSSSFVSDYYFTEVGNFAKNEKLNACLTTFLPIFLGYQSAAKSTKPVKNDRFYRSVETADSCEEITKDQLPFPGGETRREQAERQLSRRTVPQPGNNPSDGPNNSNRNQTTSSRKPLEPLKLRY